MVKLEDKIKVLRVHDLFEIAVKRSGYSRYQWDGGDDTVYRTDTEIFSDSEFWQGLVAVTARYHNASLGKGTDKNPLWLRYAVIHYKLFITDGNLKKFWLDFLNVTPRELRKLKWLDKLVKESKKEK